MKKPIKTGPVCVLRKLEKTVRGSKPLQPKALSTSPVSPKPQCKETRRDLDFDDVRQAAVSGDAAFLSWACGDTSSAAE